VNILEDPALSIGRLVSQVVGAKSGPAGSPAGSAVNEAQMRCTQLRSILRPIREPTLEDFWVSVSALAIMRDPESDNESIGSDHLSEEPVLRPGGICRGRGRGFEARRPRHISPNSTLRVRAFASMYKLEAMGSSVPSCDQSTLRRAIRFSTVEDAPFQSDQDRIEPVVGT
jgi:hypothetical protein